GGDDGETDRPPGDRLAGEEVVARGLLEAGEVGTEGRDREQVAADHQIVDPGQHHQPGTSASSPARRDPGSILAASEGGAPDLRHVAGTVCRVGQAVVREVDDAADAE